MNRLLGLAICAPNQLGSSPSLPLEGDPSSSMATKREYRRYPGEMGGEDADSVDRQIALCVPSLLSRRGTGDRQLYITGFS
jgi:hypothetical protein